MGLNISTRQFNDITVVDLHGNLVGTEGERLRVLLKSLIVDLHVGKLLLNLSDLRQIDSFGISVMVQGHLSIKKRGGDFKLLAPRGQARNALMVLHLPDLIPSFEDETQAMASFRQSPYRATSVSS